SFPAEIGSITRGVAAKSAGKQHHSHRRPFTGRQAISQVTVSQPKSRWRKLGKVALLGLGLLLLLSAVGLWYITTDSFRNLVSRRLVTQLEQITGGKAEIGSLEISPFQMRVELRDLVIHGLEKPGE